MYGGAAVDGEPGAAGTSACATGDECVSGYPGVEYPGERGGERILATFGKWSETINSPRAAAAPPMACAFVRRRCAALARSRSARNALSCASCCILS